MYFLNKDYIFWRGQFYTKQGDSSILKAPYSATCPIKTCSGQLRVKKPFSNEERVWFAGMCDKSTTHAFNFDPTLADDQNNLTRKKKSNTFTTIPIAIRIINFNENL